MPQRAYRRRVAPTAVEPRPSKRDFVVHQLAGVLLLQRARGVLRRVLVPVSPADDLELRLVHVGVMFLIVVALAAEDEDRVFAGMLVAFPVVVIEQLPDCLADRKSTRLNSSHLGISYAV